MKQRVYIETSVIGYLTGRPSRDLVVAAHQEITRQWWEERADAFELFVSDIVMEEARQGTPGSRRRRIAYCRGRDEWHGLFVDLELQASGKRLDAKSHRGVYRKRRVRLPCDLHP